MAGWRRILSYLGPHRRVLLLAALASVVYAALDAFSIVVLIPFLGAVFGAGGGSGGAAAEPSQIDRVLDFTVGRFIDLDGEPQAAVAGIIVFGLMAVQGARFVPFMIATGETGEDLDAPLWPFMGILSACAVVMVARVFSNPAGVWSDGDSSGS